MTCRLVITGCGRSGTMKLQQALLELGIKAAHEADIRFDDWENRCEALVSWTVLRNAPKLRDIGAYIVHVHRHPLYVARSYKALGFFKSGGPHKQAVYDVLGYGIDDRPYPELDFVIDWNRKCEEIAEESICIDDVNKDKLKSWCNKAGLSVVKAGNIVAIENRAINAQRTQDVEDFDLSVYDRLEELNQLLDDYEYMDRMDLSGVL